MKVANVALGNVKVPPDWSKLCSWLKRRCPDIVTLQKIGPREPSHEDELRNIGYKGWYLDHNENYLGVAILAHHEFLSHQGSTSPRVLDRELPDDDRNESRFLSISIGDLSVSSIYAPYSRSGEPTVDWLNQLRAYVDKQAYACQSSLLCGDFNVRADDTSKTMLKLALGKLSNLGFYDLYRKAHPNSEEMPGYTRGCGWEYPSRLHLVLASDSVKERLRSARTDPDWSLWPRRDAPPVVVDLDDI